MQESVIKFKKEALPDSFKEDLVTQMMAKQKMNAINAATQKRRPNLFSWDDSSSNSSSEDSDQLHEFAYVPRPKAVKQNKKRGLWSDSSEEETQTVKTNVLMDLKGKIDKRRLFSDSSEEEAKIVKANVPMELGKQIKISLANSRAAKHAFLNDDSDSSSSSFESY